MPNARNSLESKRQVIKVGSEMNGIILTNRFLPLIPQVNIDFLVMSLNLKYVRDQLISVCRGAGAPDFRENKLGNIFVPVPDSTDLSSIDFFMEEIEDKLAKKKMLKAELKSLEQEISEVFGGLL